MSFILDALRKSERERQRNERPGLAVSQAPPPRRGTGFWLPLVALLIGVNLSLLLVMWIMTQPKEAAAPVATPPAAPESSAPAPAYTAPARAETGQPPPPATAPAVAREVTPDAASGRAPAEPTGADELPTLDELLLTNAISVPPMRIDIHVYSDKPEERFVFINMNRYNEGDKMSEGPLLLRINPAGVVLRHQGRDFQVLRE